LNSLSAEGTATYLPSDDGTKIQFNLGSAKLVTRSTHSLGLSSKKARERKLMDEHRENENRLATFADVGLKAAGPLLQYQASILRLLANNCELAARNLEKNLETLSSTAKQQSGK
jgi:hypothetical protein